MAFNTKSYGGKLMYLLFLLPSSWLCQRKSLFCVLTTPETHHYTFEKKEQALDGFAMQLKLARTNSVLFQLIWFGGCLGGSVVKNLPAKAGNTGDRSSILGQADPLEWGTATHSSVLAWRIPWMEEPVDGL